MKGTDTGRGRNQFMAELHGHGRSQQNLNVQEDRAYRKSKKTTFKELPVVTPMLIIPSSTGLMPPVVPTQLQEQVEQLLVTYNSIRHVEDAKSHFAMTGNKTPQMMDL